MGCLLFKESKLNFLENLKTEGYINNRRELTFEKDVHKYLNDLINRLNLNYDLNLKALATIKEVKIKTGKDFSRDSEKFILTPIEESFEQIDNRRKELGIYEDRISIGEYNKTQSEKISNQEEINLNLFNGGEALLEQEEREFNDDNIKATNFDRIKLASYFNDNGYKNIDENTFTEIYNDYQKYLAKNQQSDIDGFIKLIESNEYIIEQDLKPFIDESNKIGEQIRDVEVNIQFSLSPEINYQLKAIEILNSQKGKQVFEKGQKNNWSLDKILTELQIPKEQKQLILDLGITDREQLALELASNYSYTVEINTAKQKNSVIHKSGVQSFILDEYEYYTFDGWEISYKRENIETGKKETITEEEFNNAAIKAGVKETDIPTQYYSNLTVPGGTNYTENEIATPAITPSIKGHAQFSTSNGIGWFRSDDKENKVVGWKEEDDFLNSETAQYNPITKDDKIIFGHPTIGKSYLKQKGNNDFITLDDDYANEVNVFIDNNRGSETRQEYKGRKPKEYNEFMLSLFDRLKLQAKKEGKKLFVSNTNILKERMSEFDKVITIPKDEFKKRFDARGATYGFEDWKSDIDITVAKVDKSKVISTTGYLSDLLEGNPKTRRILEVQSDLFQKSRDKDNLTATLQNKGDNFVLNGVVYDTNIVDFKTGEKKYTKRNSNFGWDGITKEEYDKAKDSLNKENKENNFLQLLNKDNNWVTFFVKSIIQDTAKQTITEVQQEDVEAKVRELEKEGLLEIDCKGKLKAEKGLATSFTKGGKWKVIKDLKGYPTHKEGGVDLTIGKDGVSIKNGNTQFTAKHGLVIPKN